MTTNSAMVGISDINWLFSRGDIRGCTVSEFSVFGSVRFSNFGFGSVRFLDRKLDSVFG